MMIRAWKGEDVGMEGFASPVGDADWDDSSRIAAFDEKAFIVSASDSISVCTCYITCGGGCNSGLPPAC